METHNLSFLRNFLRMETFQVISVIDGYRLRPFRVSNGTAGRVGRVKHMEDGRVSDKCSTSTEIGRSKLKERQLSILIE